MIIDMQTLDVPHELLINVAAVGATVRHLNRNKTGNGVVQLITDSQVTIKKHLVLGPKDEEFFNTCLGLTWHRHTGAHIWVSPIQRFSSTSTVTPRSYDLELMDDRAHVAQTIIHEVAHAMVGHKHNHGWTFRRMYVLLVELAGNRHLAEWIGKYFDPHQEAWTIVTKYQSVTIRHRPTADCYEEAWSGPSLRRREEVAKHMQALGRMTKRYADVHILG